VDERTSKEIKSKQLNFDDIPCKPRRYGYTLEERQIIEKCIKKGLGAKKISKILGRTKSGVAYEIARIGRDNYTAENAVNLLDAKCSPRRPDQERERIIQYHLEGMAPSVIANKTKVCRVMVYKILNEYFEELKTRMIKGEDETISALKDKIEMLEMQLDTVSEFLKNLHNP